MRAAERAAGARPIALVGLPGAGKSTVGRLLAGELGREFFDCDAAFEAQAGIPIGAWVAARGWATFRARESAILADALARERLVIATGGGVVEKPENRRALAGSAAVIWLDARPEVLAERLGAPSGRPLLGDVPAADLAELAARRDLLYAELADFRVAVAGAAPPRLVARILRELNQRASLS